MNRESWICYMLGYMISKGWRLSRKSAEDFKTAFPEVSKHLVELSTDKEDKPNG